MPLPKTEREVNEFVCSVQANDDITQPNGINKLEFTEIRDTARQISPGKNITLFEKYPPTQNIVANGFVTHKFHAPNPELIPDRLTKQRFLFVCGLHAYSRLTPRMCWRCAHTGMKNRKKYQEQNHKPPNARINRARTQRRYTQVLDESRAIRAPVECVVRSRLIAISRPSPSL
jgi:hypothetical protein